MFLVFWAIGLLFVALAIPLIRRRVRPNRWYGLRLPATFADERVWYEANARSGRDLLLLGIGTFVGASVLFLLSWRHVEHYAIVTFVLIEIGVLAVAARAFRIARQVQREVEGRPGRDSANGGAAGGS